MASNISEATCKGARGGRSNPTCESLTSLRLKRRSSDDALPTIMHCHAIRLMPRGSPAWSPVLFAGGFVDDSTAAANRDMEKRRAP